jgi:hypothetical protein
MRSTSLALIALGLFACDKNEPKKKDTKPVENATVSVTPKKVVPTKELPPLAADPGGATGKPVWQAAFGGFGIDVPKGIAVGSDGSAYVTGYFEGETDFGGTIGKRTSAGKSDVYLTKVGPDGKLAWAQTFGAARDDVANSVAVRGDKVAIAGSFLDEIKVGTFVKKSNGSDDLFIAAFDKDGNAEWLWTAGGIDSDGVNAIAATPDGGWVIGGSFIDSLSIFVGKQEVPVKSKGGTDALLIKLAPSGDTEWVKTFGGRYNDSIRHLGVDANGNIFIQGVFKDVANWGGQDLKAGGGSDDDIVLAKYDTNGDHVWSQRFGNAFDETAGGLAVDPSGHVTITGSFENKGGISFGQGDDHTSLGEADVFVARFDGAGKLEWAKSFGGARVDVGSGIASDASGNSVVSGWFEGTADFGKGALSTKTNNKDVFIVKLDGKGNTVWEQSFGDKDHDQGRAVALDDKGAAYVTGLYRFKLALVGNPVEQALDMKDPVLSKAPKPDVFVVKLER